MQAGEQDSNIDPAEVRRLFLEREAWRQKIIERSVYAGTIIFVIGIVVLVWTSDRAMEGVSKAVGIFSGGSNNRPYTNQELACRDPKNRNTPYCLERKGRQDSTWKGIERQGETPNMFTLHERG